jgi:hypothetical protein
VCTHLSGRSLQREIGRRSIFRLQDCSRIRMWRLLNWMMKRRGMVVILKALEMDKILIN